MSDQGTNRNEGEKTKPPNEPKDKGAALTPQEIVPPALESVLRNVGVDPKDPNVVSRTLEVSLMMLSGSLPIAPPPILKEYGNIRPQLVDKLIDWTEQQATHRRELEKMRTAGSERRLDRSQHNALFVALGGLCLAAVVGIWGNMWASIVIAIVSIGGPTAAIWLAHSVRKSQQTTPIAPGLPVVPPPLATPNPPQAS
jgi:uncharacterized membrane protein